MKRPLRWFVLGAAPLLGALGVFACSSSDQTRENFEADGSPAPDAGPSLPPEAGPAPDADAAITDAAPHFDAASEPVQCAATPCVVQLVAGGAHYCALLSDHTVRCWGAAAPQMGDYDAGGNWHASQNSPLDMKLSNVAELSAQGNTTCARFGEGSVKCFGGNFQGAIVLDPPSTDFAPHGPTTIPISNVAHVRIVGGDTVLAIKDSGELWSWGSRTDTLGRPDVTEYVVGPGQVNLGGAKVVNAFGGIGVAFAVTEQGELLTWGSGTAMVTYPGPIPLPLPGFVNVGNGVGNGSHVCMVADGRLYCWGQNGLQSCSGVADAILSPLEIRTHGFAHAQQVSVSGQNTFVRMSDGTIQGCGSDTNGMLGTGEADAGAAASWLLVEAKGFTGHAVSVASGDSSVCVLEQGGSVQCWGANDWGQLGQGTTDTDRHASAVRVSFE